MYLNDQESKLNGNHVEHHEIDEFVKECDKKLILHSVKEARTIISKLVKILKANTETFKQNDK